MRLVLQDFSADAFILTVVLLLSMPTEGLAMVFKKLPRAITVGKKRYTISYPETVDEGRLAGICELDDKEMEIATDQCSEEIESTVFHEILHALAHEYKFKLSEKKTLDLERALYDVFKKNRWKISLPPKRRGR